MNKFNILNVNVPFIDSKTRTWDRQRILLATFEIMRMMKRTTNTRTKNFYGSGHFILLILVLGLGKSVTLW